MKANMIYARSIAVVANFLVTNLVADEPRDLGQVLHIQDIVGVEAIARTREFFLYATPGTETDLYVDDIIRIARSVFLTGEASFSLEPEGKFMQIRYLHSASRSVPDAHGGSRFIRDGVEQQLHAIFEKSLAESTFLQSDRVMKDLSHGISSIPGLHIGLSGQKLCGVELYDWVKSGRRLTDYPDLDYVTTYEVSYTPRFDKFPRKTVWFADSKLRVTTANRDGTQPPGCVQMFAENMTSGMEEFFSHPKVGKYFWRLKALLLLVKSFGFAKLYGVPVDVSLLAAYPLKSWFENDPVPIVEQPLIFPDRQSPGEAMQIIQKHVVRGGIRFSIDGISLSPQVTQGALATPRRGSFPSRIPLVKISEVRVSGRTLVKFDLSRLVGL